MPQAPEKPPHFIRQWRKHRGLSLEQLAEQIGMSHQNLGKIERFLVPYSQPLLEALSVALRTDPASLIRRMPSEGADFWEVYLALDARQRQVLVRTAEALVGYDTDDAVDHDPNSIDPETGRPYPRRDVGEMLERLRDREAREARAPAKRRKAR